MYTYTKILTVASPCITVLDHKLQTVCYVTTVNVVFFFLFSKHHGLYSEGIIHMCTHLHTFTLQSVLSKELSTSSYTAGLSCGSFTGMKGRSTCDKQQGHKHCISRPQLGNWTPSSMHVASSIALGLVWGLGLRLTASLLPSWKFHMVKQLNFQKLHVPLKKFF